ncbi:MAG TPA: nucleotide pyrophosphatase, partial [Actinomycetota bacterium]|nr:nucleotide pyrophosphatase [Actinomycetota bacterium]
MTDGLVDSALEVLLGDELADVVDLVLLKRNGELEAHARGAAVGFTAGGPTWVRDRDPLSRQDMTAFSPLEAELGGVRPSNADNHYPYAYASIAQLFDDPR